MGYSQQRVQIIKQIAERMGGRLTVRLAAFAARALRVSVPPPPAVPTSHSFCRQRLASVYCVPTMPNTDSRSQQASQALPQAVVKNIWTISKQQCVLCTVQMAVRRTLRRFSSRIWSSSSCLRFRSSCSRRFLSSSVAFSSSSCRPTCATHSLVFAPYSLLYTSPPPLPFPHAIFWQMALASHATCMGAVPVTPLPRAYVSRVLFTALPMAGVPEVLSKCMLHHMPQ